MPVWLITFLGQAIFKVALYFLEQKWPGIAPVLSGICTHVDAQPDKEAAVERVSTHLSAMPGMPNLK